MPILKKTPLRAVRVEWFCECGGTMAFEGNVLTSYPPQYPHKCGACGKGATSDKVYPCVEHEALVLPAGADKMPGDRLLRMFEAKLKADGGAGDGEATVGALLVVLGDLLDERLGRAP